MYDQKPDGSGLHQRTIAAAMDLLRHPAATPPTLAQIAAEAGANLDDVAGIFPDVDAVYEAAAEQALLWLHDSCVKAVVKVDPDDAVAQFGALGEAYIEWAVQHERYFRLISGGHLVQLVGNPRLQRYHDSMRELMQRMLERARDCGHLAPNENIPLMVISGRSFAYGLARMIVDGRMAEWYPGTPPMIAAKQALHDFMTRIARGSRPRPSAAPAATAPA